MTPRRQIAVQIHPDTDHLMRRMRANALIHGIQIPGQGNAIDMAFMLWAVMLDDPAPEVRERYMEQLHKWGILVPNTNMKETA